MPTINQLAELDDLRDGDLIPIYAVNQAMARRVPLGKISDYISRQTVDEEIPSSTRTMVEKISGNFDYTLEKLGEENSVWLMIISTSIINSGSVTLPSSSTIPDGFEVLFTTNVDIPSCVFLADVAIYGSSMTMHAGDNRCYRYSTAAEAWVRIN